MKFQKIITVEIKDEDVLELAESYGDEQAIKDYKDNPEGFVKNILDDSTVGDIFDNVFFYADSDSWEKID